MEREHERATTVVSVEEQSAPLPTPTIYWTAGRIRALRQVLKLTQVDLASRLQTTQSLIARWETNRTTPGIWAQSALTLLGKRVTINDAHVVEPPMIVRDGRTRQVTRIADDIWVYAKAKGATRA